MFGANYQLLKSNIDDIGKHIYYRQGRELNIYIVQMQTIILNQVFAHKSTYTFLPLFLASLSSIAFLALAATEPLLLFFLGAFAAYAFLRITSLICYLQ